MYKSLSLSIVAAFLVAAHASPAAERSEPIARAATSTWVATPAHDAEAEIRPRFAHAIPSASAEQRAADIALFESMSKDLPKLPTYTRNYSVHVVNAQKNALPPNGATVQYSHLVVGTDPSSSAVQGTSGVTSTISVRLIPVVIVGPDGRVYDPSGEPVPGTQYSSVTLDQVSPVFTTQNFTIGGAPYTSSQLLDAWVRSERWQYAQSLASYHLQLTATLGGALRLTPTAVQIQDVSGQVLANGTTVAQKYGRALVLDRSYLDGQMQAYIAAQGITPDVIPVFVTSYNIMAYSFGVVGFHSNAGTQTYIWHTNFVPAGGGGVITGQALEHELSELIDHPYLTTDTDPGNCGTNGYESGDPLENGQADFAVTNPFGMKYAFQDLTYAGWNEGEFPSTAYWGRYSLNNAFRFPCF